MGVVADTTRKIKIFTVVAIVAVGSLYAYTKIDTSKDRSVTVIVEMIPVKWAVTGFATVTFNGAHRSTESIPENNLYEDTFWARPGEKIGLLGRLLQGKGSVSCSILMDGVPVGPPQVHGPGFEVACQLEAVA